MSKIDYSKDLTILNTLPDEEWTAKGMSVFDSEGNLVAETQDIEDAKYIANFNPRKERELMERIGELESCLEHSIYSLKKSISGKPIRDADEVINRAERIMK